MGRRKTLPDIALLPPLCLLLSNSADKLLGIDAEQKAAQQQEILDKAVALSQKGYHKEAREILRKGLARFPDNCEMMNQLEYNLTFLLHNSAVSEEEKANMRGECAALSERILEMSSDDELRHSATSSLISHYVRQGEVEKAEALAMKMPIMCLSREFLLADMYKGDKGKENAQRLVFNLLQFLENRMNRNYKLDSGEWLYSPKEQAVLRDKAVALLHLLFEEGDFGFYFDSLWSRHTDQAVFYANEGNAAQTLAHLANAAAAANSFLEWAGLDSFRHTSLLLKGMENTGAEVWFSGSDNNAAELLAQMEKPAFDFVRGEPAFAEIKASLEGLAGQWPAEAAALSGV